MSAPPTSATSTVQNVLEQRAGAVLTLTLNRPAKSNSFEAGVVNALQGHLDAATKDHTLNVIILTGAGRAFCAGLDLDLVNQRSPSETRAYLQTVLHLFDTIWTMPQPVIAAVNGAAIAGGFDLAAFCDLRVASEEAVFGQAEIDIGVNPILHPLARSIGLSQAKYLALTGARISAAEAKAYGLVNEVVPAAQLMPRAAELAQLLASKSRQALVETKRLARELLDQETGHALRAQGDSILRLMATPEHKKRLQIVLDRIHKKTG